MARAPLSHDELVAQAQFVVVGEVREVRETELAGDAYVEADVAVESVEKAILPLDEEAVTVHYRRIGERMPGWSGDMAQHSPLRAGERVRVFVTYDAEGRAQLLEPNGWEPAD